MRVTFYTLGCKVNQYETSALQRQFSAAGYEIVPAGEQADIYILNSCTVTAQGDKKTRQLLRRFRRNNPDAVLVLCGCFPQAFPKEAEEIFEADLVTGSAGRSRLTGLVEQYLADGKRRADILPHTPDALFEPLRIDGFSSRTRAFVKIEDGCERFCSYCIIPTARGPIRSRPLDEIRKELERLVSAGYREVVLVGINLSSYGLDLNLHLLDAVQLACSVPGLERVRLGSMEPELLTGEDIQAMAKLPQLCPQFHLSLQSGCDETLVRMNRQYDTALYRQIAADLRRAFPGCALTTDIMVGFPGETQEEFLQSLAFVREMQFARAHVFAYSPRPGTPAAQMPDQIPEAEKAARSRRMIAACDQDKRAFFVGQIGRSVPVLFETQPQKGMWEGYTPSYVAVRAESVDNLNGAILPVYITDAQDDYCFGKLSASPDAIRREPDP